MIDSPDVTQFAVSRQFETRLFIDGEFKASSDGSTFDTVNPATGEVLAYVSHASLDDVNHAVACARRAFEHGPWRRMSPKERKRVLLSFAELIERHSTELAVLESLDNGKPVRDALANDLPGTVELLRWAAEATDKIYDQVTPTSGDIVSMVIREPIGVVAAVIPWNFPLEIMAVKVGPALAAGNSLIIKPAEQTSLSLLRVASLANEAGLPPGVLNILPGFGETTGQYLGRHQDVDCLSFTGSTEVGRFFLKYAAESNLKRVFLELGGKSPVIVMDDVTDFEAVAEQVANGVLYSQGQVCSSGSRLLVHKAVKGRMLSAIERVFRRWTVGDPLAPSTRMGAMISEGHMKRVLSYVELGKKEGATLFMGGAQVLAETGGSFLEPTVFADVRNSMRIAREEIFGPVLSVIDFETVEEAIEIANDTNYGLASSLYTNDLNIAHKVSRAIRAGTVSVNCFSEGDQAVPFGGFKQSGFGGREKSLAAHDIYTQPKAIWMQLR
ncbi:aldehyde dehydrogenase [Paraburkholderia sp. EG285A]|uniref:aldehyde dehydrogenase n=1 Tax=Paraburkholderia sp. EG285A TaxID=3237009 RepID=UPI0034D228F5